MNTRRVVIDTDTGVDDALALALAAGSPELETAAITTVAGNAEVAECTRNVLLLAEGLWPGSPPIIAEGAAAPLSRPLTTAPEVHGADGLGGRRGTLPEPRLEVSDVPAHELLVRLAADSAGETTLVATGPLTNLALALDSDPGSLARFREIVVMGGALNVPGNTGPCAEFNFYVDPEAADVVLRAGLDVTVVPLDVTTTVELSRASLERLPGWSRALSGGAFPRTGVDGTDAVRRALARALDYYIRFQADESGLDAGYMHDPVAVAASFARGLVGTAEMPLTVVTYGPERGRSVEAKDDRPAVRVAVNADRAGVLELLTERVLRPLFG
jgi:purine nucleosidase